MSRLLDGGKDERLDSKTALTPVITLQGHPPTEPPPTHRVLLPTIRCRHLAPRTTVAPVASPPSTAPLNVLRHVAPTDLRQLQFLLRLTNGWALGERETRGTDHDDDVFHLLIVQKCPRLLAALCSQSNTPQIHSPIPPFPNPSQTPAPTPLFLSRQHSFIFTSALLHRPSSAGPPFSSARVSYPPASVLSSLRPAAARPPGLVTGTCRSKVPEV